jgi:hypothetical protein
MAANLVVALSANELAVAKQRIMLAGARLARMLAEQDVKIATGYPAEPSLFPLSCFASRTTISAFP